MAEGFPSTYVDPQTGEVKRLGSIWDRIESDGLPKLADYALSAGKIALLASAAAVVSPVLAVAAVALPVGFWLVEKASYKGFFNRIYDASLDETKSGGEQYNMATPQGQAKFVRHFGDSQPSFGQDYLRMVKMAGLKTAPTIIVREAEFDGWGRFGGSQNDYNAGAISRADGSNPSIEIGQGVIEQMTPGELRAIIGHEITHLALGHTKDRMSWKARRMPGMLLTAALAGAAIFGFVPLLPAIALVGVSLVASTCLESINSRRREELCDRGKGRIKVQEESKLHRFMHATHPATERRAGLLEKFEQKYHAFCEKQRSLFRDTFNARARRSTIMPDPVLSQTVKSVRHYPGGTIVIMRRPGSAYSGY